MTADEAILQVRASEAALSEWADLLAEILAKGEGA